MSKSANAGSMPTRSTRTPAELRKLAAACRKDAADTRRALPRVSAREQELMKARIYRLERLASEMERAAQQARGACGMTKSPQYPNLPSDRHSDLTQNTSDRHSDPTQHIARVVVWCRSVQEQDLFAINPALLRALVEATSRLANLGQAVRIDRATGVRHDH